jgi:hypothetical protein
VADTDEQPPRILRELDKPEPRVRVEYSRNTILVHLRDEDGTGWTILALGAVFLDQPADLGWRHVRHRSVRLAV